MLPIWLDGELVEADHARVAVVDHGLTVGDGAFETMRTERGVPFAVGRHLRRLRRSLDGLGLDLAWSDDALRDALQQVTDHLEGAAGRIRLTVTGGPGPLGSGREAGRPTVFAVAGPATPRPPTGTAVLVPWRRNEHSPVAGLKTTSYAENVVALARAREEGADEALLANTAGDLCEGTGSNVFVVLDGRLRTPPLASGCLAGITRELVCELVDVDEETIPLDALDRAEELFLTSSTRDVQGLHRVGRRTLDAPGPVTRQVGAAFADLVARTVDP